MAAFKKLIDTRSWKAVIKGWDHLKIKDADGANTDKSNKKSKSIAFVTNTDEEELESDKETDESISDAIVLLGRQFNKILRRVERRPRQNARNIQFDIGKQGNTSKKTRTGEKTSQGKGVQCHECEGFGHIRSECATYLKKQRKSLNVSWSDEEDSECEMDNETTKQVNAMTNRCLSDTDSSDEDATYQELVTTYKELLTRSEEVCKISEKQKKTIALLQAEKSKLLSTISDLNEEVVLLDSKLEHLKKQVRMMNKGTDTLE
jgi:hypothetical protein